MAKAAGMADGRLHSGSRGRRLSRLPVLLPTMLALVGGLAPALAASRHDGAVVVRPPVGVALTVDGSWTGSEWEHSTKTGNDEVEVRFNRIDGFLQIGVRARSLAVASICILQDQRVHVLHASAALGRAVYLRTEDGWELQEPFEWRLRGAELTPEAAAERLAHRKEHGWVASTTHMGAREQMEFQISSAYLTADGTRLAVGVFVLEDGEGRVEGWPFGGEEDGSTRREVIAGPLPDRVRFDVERWALVDSADLK